MSDNASASSTGPSPVALVTGGSRGLGRALAARLAADGWRVVVDGRDPAVLAEAARHLTDAAGAADRVVALPGDVTDPAHRADLAAAVTRSGRLDLLVNNASTLGPVPLPALAELPESALREVVEVNLVAPLALVRLVLPLLRRSAGRVVDVSSDAAVEAYPGWGAYGAAKAALDRSTAVLAAEEPSLRCYALDPGDLDTDLHRQADPDADPADLASPESVVPALLRLATGDLPSGRYRAADLFVDVLPAGRGGRA